MLEKARGGATMLFVFFQQKLRGFPSSSICHQTTNQPCVCAFETQTKIHGNAFMCERKSNIRSLIKMHSFVSAYKRILLIQCWVVMIYLYRSESMAFELVLKKNTRQSDYTDE